VPKVSYNIKFLALLKSHLVISTAGRNPLSKNPFLLNQRKFDAEPVRATIKNEK